MSGQVPSGISTTALSGDNTRAGAQAAFGSAVNTIYAFDKADVVVALDSDFSHGTATSIRYAQDVASKRRVTSDEPVMSRIYVAEPTPTNTVHLAVLTVSQPNRQILRSSRRLLRRRWGLALCTCASRSNSEVGCDRGRRPDWQQQANLWSLLVKHNRLRYTHGARN
jgi:hypothetical protein